MSIEIQEEATGKIVVVRVSGKLTAEDYERFLPEIEQLVDRRGKIRILFEMEDFHGWDLAAGWEDLKFGIRHYKDIERLAAVGDKAWEHAMTTLWRPFTSAEVRYFDRSEAEQARRWIEAE